MVANLGLPLNPRAVVLVKCLKNLLSSLQFNPFVQRFYNEQGDYKLADDENEGGSPGFHLNIDWVESSWVILLQAISQN